MTKPTIMTLKKFTKCCLFILVALYIPGSEAQTPDTLRSPLAFAKYRSSFRKMVRIEKFGRAGMAFDEAYFMDMRLPLKERTLLPCGPFLLKMERYCKRNAIWYNKKELRQYRWTSGLAGFLFVTALGGYIPVTVDAVNNAQGPVHLSDPLFYFSSPNAPILWSLIVVNCITAHVLKVKAELRLERNLFLTDSIAGKS